MSHDDDCHDHGHDHGGDHGGDGGGPQSGGFLDLEISKVLFAEAEGVTREAFRELLKDAAKREFQARWGERIDALAKLAVDELLTDIAANLEIEAKIAARSAAREGLDDRVQAIFSGDGDGNGD